MAGWNGVSRTTYMPKSIEREDQGIEADDRVVRTVRGMVEREGEPRISAQTSGSTKESYGELRRGKKITSLRYFQLVPFVCRVPKP